MTGLTLVGAALLVSACGGGGGGDDGPGNDPPALYPLKPDSAFAEEYFVQDLRCQTGAESAALADPRIYRWTGAASTLTATSLRIDSGGTLAAGPVASTSYGFQQQANCASPDEGPQCGRGATLVAAMPRALKLCAPPAQGGYARASVEGVALTTLASLAEARDFYLTLPSRQATIRPAGLLVLPTIERKYADGSARHVSTDNLAYAPAFAGEPTFVIFPKSRRARDLRLWQGANLWEIPWGLAHEYGHHVFRTHTGVASVGKAVLGEEPAGPAPLLPEPVPGGRSGLALTAAGRQVGDAEIWSAVNEAFADLYAAFSFGWDNDPTKGLDCFDQSRSARSPVFSTGAPKALSQGVLDLFMATSTVTSAGCKEPNYQDVHTIGAIIAYGAGRILQPVAADDVRRAEMILAWARRLGDHVRSRPAAASLTLEALIGHLLPVAAAGGRLNADQCAAVREVFPVFAGTLLAADYGCG